MIQLKNVNLTFKERAENSETIKDLFITLTSNDQTKLSVPFIIHSLKDINLSISAGENIALLGTNGSGKSSLCHLLSGFYIADTGICTNPFKTRHIHSSTSALFPELSAWDNLVLMVRLLYNELTNDEVIKAAEEIFHFAELDNFKKLPVKKYSKGMAARLILTLVTAFPSELLIIDELFDGADQFFMAKFENRMKMAIDQSKVTIFVSHNIETIRNYCKRGIVLENGKISYDGNITKAIFYYQNSGKKQHD